MASNADTTGPTRGNRLRLAIWGTAAALLLLLPAIAMQFTSEVAWDETDFIVMGAMLGLACGAYELAVRLSDSRAYRAGFGLTIVTCFLLVWLNLAVGIIGTEENRANAMYLGVLALVAACAVAVRGRPRGMAWVTIAAAVAQATIAGIALGGSLGSEDQNWPLDTLGILQTPTYPSVPHASPLPTAAPTP
jgi:peptidoglycan/LPS O-acetylase OafA/YrhL